ncbi:MAG TPA: PD-(D/E)XK nuclease family protein [candidate division Zixibacteria bacterium]|nr:PD-(D/E)XK nuclease family protein [candidate division Zixibacteria bacterium]
MPSMYSYSSLETFRICPKKFQFTYVDKVPVEEKVAADTYLGSAVHRALRKLYTAGGDGVLIPLNDIVKFYHSEWNKLSRELISVTSDFYTVDDYIRIGEEMLARHYEKHKPFSQGTLLGAEMHLVCTLPDTPFKFRCYIDRLWKKESGEVEICDYKTGQTLARPQDPKFFFQMGIYQLAVQQNFPKYEDISVAQYFLRKDEIVSYRFSPDEITQLVEQLRQAVLASLQAAKLNDFPAQEGTHCNYCDFVSVCPAKKHRQLLDEEVQSGGSASAERLRELANRYVEKNQVSKTIKSELDSLKAELLEIARERDMSVFEGDTGRVSVKINTREKFVTKSEDEQAFADLNAAARTLGLDDYFVVDATSLLKDVYLKKMLPEDQLDKLSQFIVRKEEPRVTVKRTHQSDKDEEIV